MAKKAQPPYFIWLGGQRGSIVEKYGLQGKKSSEVIKKAGEVWKAMDPADKKKYEDLAAKDKERYEEEVKTLGKRKRVSANDEDAPEGKRAKKDKSAPKKPQVPYFAWLTDNRQAIAAKYKVEGPEIPKKAAEEWKTVTADVKAEYKAKFKAATAQYKKDLAAHKGNNAANSGDAAVKEGGAKNSKGVPKKPPVPYFAWLADNRQAIAAKYKVKGPEVPKKAAEEWKTVTADIKAEYTAKFKAAKAQYKKDLAAHKANKTASNGSDSASEGHGKDDVVDV